MKINNNMTDFFEIFKLFVHIQKYDENKYREYLGELFSELEFYQSKFDILNKVLSFSSKFYPFSKKNEIKSLSDYKNQLIIYL